MEEIGPQLLGRDPRRLEVIDRVGNTALPGHLYVKSALDTAAGGARNRGGVTRAREAPGLDVAVHEESLGGPVAVYV